MGEGIKLTTMATFLVSRSRLRFLAFFVVNLFAPFERVNRIDTSLRHIGFVVYLRVICVNSEGDIIGRRVNIT